MMTTEVAMSKPSEEEELPTTNSNDATPKQEEEETELLSEEEEEELVPPKRRSQRRSAVHEGVNDTEGWTQQLLLFQSTCSREEIQVARGGHWRRRSSSLVCLGVDDWAAPPTSISDLNPFLPTDDRYDDNNDHDIDRQSHHRRRHFMTPSSSASSLIRRASSRFGSASSLSGLQKPLLHSTSSTQLRHNHILLNRVEEPMEGSQHVDDDDDDDEDYDIIMRGTKVVPEPKTPQQEQSIQDTSSSSSNNWIWYAMGVTIMGVGTSIPFNAMMAADPGSPLFVAFVTHIFLVVCNLHKVALQIWHRGGKTTLPLSYHLVCVLLGYSYNVLRADASTRLPPAVAMVLMNTRMLIGMTYDFVVWKTRYSIDQVLSASIITLGIVWSGISTSYAAAAAAAAAAASNKDDDIHEDTTPQQQYDGMSMAIGAGELLLGLTLVTILTTTVKIGFRRYGECPEEQVLFQHLLALPMFYCIQNQWDHIGPRLHDWTSTSTTMTSTNTTTIIEGGGGGGGSSNMALLLGSNLILTMGHTHSLALFTARAPNMLLYQIVDTVKKFVIVVVTAMGRAPPYPPIGFWGGSTVLVVGTLRFLSVSQPPQEEEDEHQDEQEEPSGRTTTGTIAEDDELFIIDREEEEEEEEEEYILREGETKKTK